MPSAPLPNRQIKDFFKPFVRQSSTDNEGEARGQNPKPSGMELDGGEGTGSTSSYTVTTDSGQLSGKCATAAPKPALPPKLGTTDPLKSLKALLKQKEKREQEEKRIQEAEMKFEEEQRQRASAAREERPFEADLKGAMSDDSDGAERMMLAMARTEALSDVVRFNMFSSGESKTPRYPFPSQSLDHSMCWLSNEESRFRASLCGFVAELAAQELLSTPCLEWFGQEVLHENREDLRDAYVAVIEAIPKTMATAMADTFLPLSRQLQLTMSGKQGCQTSNVTRARGSESPPALDQYMRVVSHLAAVCGSMGQRTETIQQLALCLVDEHLEQDTATIRSASDGIEHILNGIPQSDLAEAHFHVSRALFNTPLPREIMYRLIAALPATTERARQLRRRLALQCFSPSTPGSSEGMLDALSISWFDDILSRLKHAREFNVSETTDYAELDALIAVLDVAIGPGFSDIAVPSQPPDPASADFKKPQLPAETTFNAKVDGITAQLQMMSSRIRGAGANHLRRAEAKSSIERLIKRLEYGVRTRPKPRKGVFESASAEQKDLLSNFVKGAQDQA